MFQLGPYRFSGTDVQRTLADAEALFDLLPGAGAGDRWPAAASRTAATAALRAAGSIPEQTLEVWWGHWRTAMAELREAGAYGPRSQGTVAGLFSGRGGVPKEPQMIVEVTWGGVVGDRQATRRHHGRPWQALSLWSGEVIAALAAAGHPVTPGSAGENITLTGLDWSRVVPGARLRLGTVCAEVSAYAIPCKQIAGSFADGRFARIHHRFGPVSRVYATVLEPGSISLDDRAVLEP